MLHRLDDDDGVVDHEADGQHQAEERQRVDREPSSGNRAKVPTRDTGTASRGIRVVAPPLEEDEHDNEHQEQGLEERLHDLPDALGDGERRVERDHVVETSGKLDLRLVHQRLGLPHGVDGVGARQLVDRDDGGRVSVRSGRV